MANQCVVNSRIKDFFFFNCQKKTRAPTLFWSVDILAVFCHPMNVSSSHNRPSTQSKALPISIDWNVLWMMIIGTALATIWPPAERTPPASRRRRSRPGCLSTRRTRTRRKARRSCWPSSPKWRWPKCPHGSPTPGEDSRRRTRWRGSQRTAMTTTTTTATAAEVTTNPRRRLTANLRLRLNRRRWSTRKSIKVIVLYFHRPIVELAQRILDDCPIGSMWLRPAVDFALWEIRSAER